MPLANDRAMSSGCDRPDSAAITSSRDPTIERMRTATSWPEISGSPMSTNATSISYATSTSTASIPEAAARTSCPRSSRSSTSISRVSRSSSTTSTRLLAPSIWNPFVVVGATVRKARGDDNCARSTSRT